MGRLQQVFWGKESPMVDGGIGHHNAIDPEAHAAVWAGIAKKQRVMKEKEAAKRNAKVGVVEYGIGDRVLIRQPPKQFEVWKDWTSTLGRAYAAYKNCTSHAAVGGCTMHASWKRFACRIR